MRIFIYLLIAVLLTSNLAFAKEQKSFGEEKARGLWVQAYENVLDADKYLDEQKDARKAEDLYYGALKQYIAVEELAPEMLTAIVQYRISYCNNKVLELRKKRDFTSKYDPVDEARMELKGKVTPEKIEELLNIRNMELAEVKKELELTCQKLEKGEAELSAKQSELDSKIKELDEAHKEMDRKVQETSTEGFISVKELNEIVAPLKKKIEELKNAYKNAKTPEEKAKILEEYVAFIEALNQKLRFEDLHLAGMNIETIIIDVRDQSNPVIYKNNEKINDPTMPQIKYGAK